MNEEQFDALIDYIDRAIYNQAAPAPHVNDVPRMMRMNEELRMARDELRNKLVNFAAKASPKKAKK